ncbi:MAG: SoxR reducing system RseC family protein [Uliginosibacterium sp.]|nr:SoxR reducing system RseC family protein [Uliginosibacterium sp.]
MLIHGTVTEVCGDSAIVSVMRASGCGRCSEAGGCGVTAGCQTYTLANGVAAGPGEAVELEVPEGGAWRAAALGYLLPLCGILAGATVGKFLQFSDLALFVACLLGGGLALGASAFAMRTGLVAITRPRIVRVTRA